VSNDVVQKALNLGFEASVIRDEGVRDKPVEPVRAAFV
jgi:hypothetical protein